MEKDGDSKEIQKKERSGKESWKRKSSTVHINT